MDKKSFQLAILGGEPVRTRQWPQWPRVTNEVQKELLGALNSGRWAISGSCTGKVCYERQFSKAFAEFMRVDYCTPTTSGTNALLLALLALGVGPGNEVLVPGLTWVACASVVTFLGATPILIDVDLQSLTMSLPQAKQAITERTKAIMLVHLFGSVGDLDGFISLSKEKNIPIIEDCAQAHGAEWKRKPVGTWGAIGCFSMQQSKLLTSGEGGAVITNDPKLAYLIEQLRSDGRIFSQQPQIGKLELIEVGDVQGHNMCLSEFQSAVLLGGLKALNDDNKTRMKRAEILSTLLREVGVAPLRLSDNITFPTYYNYAFKCDLREFNNNSIDSIARALSMELSTNVNTIYKPLNKHPLYVPSTLNLKNFSLPNADEARETYLTLHHSILLEDEESMHDIAAAIEKVKEKSSTLLNTMQEASNIAF